MLIEFRSCTGALALFVTALATGAAMAHEAPAAALLRLSASPAPLAARYLVTVTPAATRGAKREPVRHHEWCFVRDATQVALLKGNIDEAWHRDARGDLSFERVFHDEQRVVDYSAGELRTLGVQADWVALSSFVDPRELVALKVVARSGGNGPHERTRLRGTTLGEVVTIDWRPAVQLPALVLREGKGGGSTRIELAEAAGAVPAACPEPGARSAAYLRMDAADFGDMDYEAVVRKSEALDIRSGWRSVHRHD